MQVDKHNEGVAYVAPYLDSVSEDLTKVLSLLALLVQKYKYWRSVAGCLPLDSVIEDLRWVRSLLALLVQKYKY